ncbi:UDP-2,3-diacylglucosamine diphosphatase [Candidatus Fermentibacterales bacterium]|nr:UDP-2,3-diacylglucosamine diphosphatase [Candidatus Fermentibacterales bacterium]
MTHYFLSDAHLFPEPLEHPGREALIRFLGSLATDREPGSLWILGDLFDFWFEFRGRMPAGFERVLRSLRALTDSGWSGSMIPGNHDFWLDGRFEESTGFHLIGDPFTLKLQGGNALLAHGDALGGGDYGYRLILRPLLRARLSARLFGGLPEGVGNRIARMASGTSKRILRREVDSIPKGLLDWVSETLDARDDVRIVITGHTHVPLITGFERGIHISLGDWISHRSFATIDDRTGEFGLVADHAP